MFYIRTHKKWIVAGFLSVLFLALVISRNPISFNDTPLESIAVGGQSTASITNTSLAPSQSTTQAQETVPVKSINNLDVVSTSTPELEKWRAARGYSLGEYESYSEETLLSLAKAGDMRALIALGNLRSGSIGYDGAAPAYINAAIQGSTAALLRLALIEETAHFDKAKTAQEQKKYALKVLAWYRLASLRGDKWPETATGRYFIESKRITLSDADNKKIQSMAEKLYADMQQTRNQLRLGEFDNSTYTIN